MKIYRKLIVLDSRTMADLERFSKSVRYSQCPEVVRTVIADIILSPEYFGVNKNVE